VILVEKMLVCFATLTEVVVAELQLRDNGTSLMGLKLGVTHRSLTLMVVLKSSSLEIGKME
jgi:hypothetical protein